MNKQTLGLINNLLKHSNYNKVNIKTNKQTYIEDALEHNMNK